MRLWSLHPKYLDRQGLLGLWREGLLAAKVLRGETKGYKNHPQLDRWREKSKALDDYLHGVADEMERRGYKPSRDKLRHSPSGRERYLRVTAGQVWLEREHLINKLRVRKAMELYALQDTGLWAVVAHPIFTIETGCVEAWERLEYV